MDRSNPTPCMVLSPGLHFQLSRLYARMSCLPAAAALPRVPLPAPSVGHEIELWRSEAG